MAPRVGGATARVFGRRIRPGAHAPGLAPISQRTRAHLPPVHERTLSRRRCTSARSLAAGARAHALSPTHSRVPAAPCSSPLPVPPPGRHGEADLASPGHCLLDEPPRVRWSFPLADAFPRARGSLQLAPACVSSGTARRGRPCEPGLVSPGRPSCLVLVAEDGATTTRTISQVRDRRL